MADSDDPLVERLMAVMSDPEARPSTVVQAAKELAKLREPAPLKEVAADRPVDAMRVIVDRYCPEVEGLEGDLDGDPMRDLQFAHDTIARGLPAGREADPLLWTWCPYCPADPVQAERAIVSAARRLGVGAGPYKWPPASAGDELAAKRRKRAG